MKKIRLFSAKAIKDIEVEETELYFKMKKCNACGRSFRLFPKNRYEVEKKPTWLKCLTKEAVYFNAFDCPHCGCPNIGGVLGKAKRSDIVEDNPIVKEIEENADSD